MLAHKGGVLVVYQIMYHIGAKLNPEEPTERRQSIRINRNQRQDTLLCEKGEQLQYDNYIV